MTVKAVSFSPVEGDPDRVMLQLACGHEVGPLLRAPHVRRPDVCPACEASADPSPLSVLLALTDASGSTLRVEHDASDGRTYLTVTFDGHDAPFELGSASAGNLATALRDWQWGAGGAAAARRGRERIEAGEAVKRASAAVKRGGPFVPHRRGE